MSHRFEQLYRERAEFYHQFVLAEDCDGNLASALQAVLSSSGHGVDAGLDAIEIGFGTGRVTGVLLACGARSILGIEREPSMLAIARQYVPQIVDELSARCTLDLRQGDVHDGIPSADQSADLVIAGWVLGHLTEWHDDWRARLDSALAEMERVSRMGGVQIVIETLGVGVPAPQAPTEALAEFHRSLEQKYGFQRTELPTDYQFASIADAIELCGGFFGEGVAELIRAHSWTRVPEWTGLWSRTRGS